MVKYVFFWLSANVFETGFYLYPCIDKKQEKKGTWWKKKVSQTSALVPQEQTRIEEKMM